MGHFLRGGQDTLFGKSGPHQRGRGGDKTITPYNSALRGGAQNPSLFSGRTGGKKKKGANKYFFSYLRPPPRRECFFSSRKNGAAPPHKEGGGRLSIYNSRGRPPIEQLVVRRLRRRTRWGLCLRYLLLQKTPPPKYIFPSWGVVRRQKTPHTFSRRRGSYKNIPRPGGESYIFLHSTHDRGGGGAPPHFFMAAPKKFLCRPGPPEDRGETTTT